MKLYSYNNGSASAKALANALGIKRLRHEGKPVKHPIIINWGASVIEREIANYNEILNEPANVAKAVNKLTTLSLFTEHGVACPEWTEGYGEADKWLADGSSVVARYKLNGHSGEGIEILDTDRALQVMTEQRGKAPLYTKYVKKDQEYRIHVFQGEVIFQQRKARKIEVPDAEVNWQVRNLAGGFIFANDGVEASDAVKDQAKSAVDALGLDFGAVDVITNKRGEAFVLEVNTACGLQGKTLDAYVQAFSRYR